MLKGDVNDPNSRITRMSSAEARAAIKDGTVTGGMIPKPEEAMAVVEQEWARSTSSASSEKAISPSSARA